MTDWMQQLIAISRHYGSDSAFVLAGGGNTSFKRDDRIWVKASGHALATIDERGFVELDRIKLDAMMNATWPTDAAERESKFMAAVMAARARPELNQRPSVEALLHHLLPGTFVVHTHPGIVNAITCCTIGRKLISEWFGGRVLWQPYVDPGLMLALGLRESLGRAADGSTIQAIFLQNHGLIVAGESAGRLEATHRELVDRVSGALHRLPTPPAPRGHLSLLEEASRALNAAKPELNIVTDASPAAMWLAGTAEGLAASTAGALTPDQIVYCRAVPLRVNRSQPSHAIGDEFESYAARYGMEPWLAVIEGAGVAAFRTSISLARTALNVFLDAAAIYRDATRMGGVRTLSASQCEFIENWEVEAYRRSVSVSF